KGEVYEVRRKNLTKNKKELEVVEVYVAQERKIEEGKTFDLLINPLSVPTRLNIGQLLETILSEASLRLGEKLLVRPFNTLAPNAIQQIIQEAGIKDCGNRQLFDGRTGQPFANKIYTGYTYTLKLNHMVADKIHARNTGPYSLIYQQPLKGRSQEGGLRLGEMEILALIAYGAAKTVNEIGAKSDAIHKRQTLKNFLLFGNRPPNLQSQLSFGEITNTKTINARTGKRVKDGLLDPVKGGPSKNFECECGVLKGVDNKGRVCERCGVLVDEKYVNSQLISVILDEIIAKEKTKNSVVKEAQKLKEKLSNAEEELTFLEEYLDFMAQHQKIKVGIGSEALQVLLREINLENQLAKAREKKQ
ncbi:95_t:CDS:2, partial [Cetraspora pellucida]